MLGFKITRYSPVAMIDSFCKLHFGVHFLAVAWFERFILTFLLRRHNVHGHVVGYLCSAQSDYGVKMIAFQSHDTMVQNHSPALSLQTFSV